MGPGPANILSAAVMQEITTQLAIDKKNPRKKLIVFKGEGKHFSFGASVEEHTPEFVNEMIPQFNAFIGEVLSCEIPTLSAVTGLCLGGSFELALATTFVIAEEFAKFAVPEIQLAVFPPAAAILLPLKTSDTFANEILLTGEQVSAQRLAELGLINLIVEKGTIDVAVDAFFEKNILPKSASSLKIAHQAVRYIIVDAYQKNIQKLEDLYLKDLMGTKDAVEGITAFIEKRKPFWENS